MMFPIILPLPAILLDVFLHIYVCSPSITRKIAANRVIGDKLICCFKCPC